MPQYIVSQRPKAKWRHHYRTPVAIIEAGTAAEAIRKACAISHASSECWFAPSLDFCAPTAELLKPSHPYLF